MKVLPCLVALAGVIGATRLDAQAPLAAPTVGDGALLVATPAMTDPNFARSVVLVLRRDDNGTLGVVLNRVTSLRPIDVFPELSPALAAYPGTLFRGGPAGAARVLFLVTGLAAAVVQGPEILEDLFLSGDFEQLPEIASLAEGPMGLRVFAGHAEWTPGQLEREIAAGSWQVTTGSVDLVFAEPAAIWERATALTGGVVAAVRKP